MDAHRIAREGNRLVTMYWRKERNARCGVYRIVHKVSRKSYVGQSSNIGDRWISHMSPNGSAISSAIEASPMDFTFEILELCPVEDLNRRENHYIDLYDCITNGYNLKGGSDTDEYPPTPYGPMTEAESRKAFEAKPAQGHRKASDSKMSSPTWTNMRFSRKT